MGSRLRRSFKLFLAVGVIAGALWPAPPAQALFHLMKVTEVFGGTASQPAAQFIELQMYADNQRFLATHEVVVFDASGNEAGAFTFTGPVSNGANQSHVLIATTEAEEAFGVTADLAMDASITLSGGKACFRGSDGSLIDCASWGTYSGDHEGSGTPFNAPIGLVADRSMERKTSGGDNKDGLDAGDDTNDSADDFELASPSPTNNAGNAPPPSENEEHKRSISLNLTSGGTAKGRVSVRDDFDRCRARVPVKIQRRANYGWRTVESLRTDNAGRYRSELRDPSGRYRAKATRVGPVEGHDCLAAVSRVRRA
jgi:hypothetical protein